MELYEIFVRMELYEIFVRMEIEWQAFLDIPGLRHSKATEYIKRKY